MSADAFVSYWALWAAAAPVAIAVIVVSAHVLRLTSRGRLQKVLTDHRQTERLRRQAERRVHKAEKQVARLAGRAEKVRPRVLQEAREALEDAKALQKIADDRALVTANHVRKVIFEEFPPSRHEAMRKRYLPDDIRDGRPFTF